MGPRHLDQATDALCLNVLQVLPYDMLQAQLSISTVRDLEDFLITDCFYTGVTVGPLYRERACRVV